MTDVVYDPYSAEIHQDPYPVLSRLRAEGPRLPQPGTRHLSGLALRGRRFSEPRLGRHQRQFNAPSWPASYNLACAYAVPAPRAEPVR